MKYTVARGLAWLLYVAVPGLAPAMAIADDAIFRSAATALATTDRTQIRSAVEKLRVIEHPRVRLIFESLSQGRLFFDDRQQLRIRTISGYFDALGELNEIAEPDIREPADAESAADRGSFMPVPINNAIRRVLSVAIAEINLTSGTPELRLSAAAILSENPNETNPTAIRTAIDRENDREIKNLLQLILAQRDIYSVEPEQRLAAVRILGQEGDTRVRSLLEQLPLKFPEDQKLRSAVDEVLMQLNYRERTLRSAANIFYGLSLGSVLVLTALGLAITFGLMGIINMAHGEMLLPGAYAAYVMQNIFRELLPAWFDWYLLAAIPIAFAASAALGMLLERFVIRHLYGRPLETLLATWGISLMLIQSARLIFGAQNVEVINPTWLSGGLHVASGLVLPYNRLATIGFALFTVSVVWFLFQRTTLGLKVRAVTQIRPMAACMGIDTKNVDMWTFGIGSGVAGLGGVALSQLGNVGPELGQSWIVDCFMVVVLGGVGTIIGTVFSAFGLGVVSKLLEPFAGPVLGKIAVLIFIILFIQFRPQGLLALKGQTNVG